MNLLPNTEANSRSFPSIKRPHKLMPLTCRKESSWNLLNDKQLQLSRERFSFKKFKTVGGETDKEWWRRANMLEILFHV
jgi:hypothetical protein